MYELIIIGGGPAGVAAGVYACRKKLNSLIITKEWGGQSKVSPEIQNWIGIKSISGSELAERMEEHIKAYANKVLEFDEDSEVVRVRQIKTAEQENGPIFEIETDQGKKYQSRAIIIASGAHRRRLGVPGDKEFESKGVVYCASCDAPLFDNKVTAVIGGGNAGLETAQQLLAYSPKIYILEYMDKLSGDPITREKLLANDKIVPIASAEVLKIEGDSFVNKLVYRDRKSKEEKELSVEGVFVEIGSVPNSNFVKGLVETNRLGEIVIDHKCARTSIEGIWAAGDVTDKPYKQNNISMGDAVTALEDLYVWAQKRKAKGR